MATKLRSPKFTVEVTQDDIDLAIPKTSSHCMIADAIQRILPDAKFVSVDLATIRLTVPKDQVRYTYLTPTFVQAALLDFDQGILPTPFSFELRRAAQITRAGRLRPTEEKDPVKRAELQKKRRDDILRKKRLQPEGGRSVPTVVGGAPPPAFRIGRRREFGLRIMGK